MVSLENRARSWENGGVAGQRRKEGPLLAGRTAMATCRRQQRATWTAGRTAGQHTGLLWARSVAGQRRKEGRATGAVLPREFFTVARGRHGTGQGRKGAGLIRHARSLSGGAGILAKLGNPARGLGRTWWWRRKFERDSNVAKKEGLQQNLARHKGVQRQGKKEGMGARVGIFEITAWSGTTQAKEGRESDSNGWFEARRRGSWHETSSAR